ncbi:hypothetical protein BDD12DRAFT_885448 [Trichophaea hybrida]|nr:hypothetical protein BDD12DRAFT_885448 [Trichophaea hybrida]
MSTEIHTVIDPPKLDTKSATPTKEIGYTSIGLALYTRTDEETDEETDEVTDEETDDIRNTGAPNANQIVIQPKNAERGSAPRFRAKTTPPEVQNINPERKEMMNEHVTTSR